MIEFPLELTLEMTDEALMQEMDGEYDPDCYDEDSVDWLGTEKGYSMEPVRVENWEELDDLLEERRGKYVISEPHIREEYFHWLENKKG